MEAASSKTSILDRYQPYIATMLDEGKNSTEKTEASTGLIQILEQTDREVQDLAEKVDKLSQATAEANQQSSEAKEELSKLEESSGKERKNLEEQITQLQEDLQKAKEKLEQGKGLCSTEEGKEILARLNLIIDGIQDESKKEEILQELKGSQEALHELNKGKEDTELNAIIGLLGALTTALAKSDSQKSESTLRVKDLTHKTPNEGELSEEVEKIDDVASKFVAIQKVSMMSREEMQTRQKELEDNSEKNSIETFELEFINTQIEKIDAAVAANQREMQAQVEALQQEINKLQTQKEEENAVKLAAPLLDPLAQVPPEGQREGLQMDDRENLWKEAALAPIVNALADVERQLQEKEQEKTGLGDQQTADNQEQWDNLESEIQSLKKQQAFLTRISEQFENIQLSDVDTKAAWVDEQIGQLLKDIYRWENEYRDYLDKATQAAGDVPGGAIADKRDAFEAYITGLKNALATLEWEKSPLGTVQWIVSTFFAMIWGVLGVLGGGLKRVGGILVSPPKEAL